MSYQTRVRYSKQTMDRFDDEEGSCSSGRAEDLMKLEDSTEPGGSNVDSTRSSTTVVDEAKELRETMIRDEERAVQKVRILLGACVAACGIAITAAVYVLGKARSDKAMFEVDYEGLVENIQDLVRWEVRYNFALMEQCSASISIAAGLMNSTFPYVTLPQYEITGGFVDGMGGIMTAAFAPFVTEEQREQWGIYSRKNQGWIENSAMLHAVHPVHRDALHGTIQDHEHDRRLQETTSNSNNNPPKQSISRAIYRWENGQKVPELTQPGNLYAPLWQVSPADYGVVNVNLLSDHRIVELYEAMLKANTGVMSRGYEIEEIFDFLFDPDEKVYKDDPHSLILQPVYDKIVAPENQTLVGVLLGVTPYGNLLDRLLPDGKDGLIAVLKDDCGNTMSFEMSSSKAKFLGYEDLHEEKYNNYERVEPNIQMYKERIKGVCTHDLYLYPSTKLVDSYSTTNHVLFTTMVALSFAAVFALFVLYDFVVSRRQKKTFNAALSSHAIIRSLFPEQVGKQLIQEAANAAEANKNAPNKEFDAEAGHLNGSLITNDGKTNATLYPDATVMFADLVGFTAWSSMREPSQVFTLLETIYDNFDHLAKSRRVFKVETVGDCYVAVCGLPEPQKQHHLQMARFARDCIYRINPVLEALSSHLGPDTIELGVRIGLHSGPITAGVLRGDRARFQLFGDTVNTCARIESTGKKNLVHVSRETADLLTQSGKGHWLKQREDTVYAKGKGELSTWWLLLKKDSEARSEEEGTNSTDSEPIEIHVDSSLINADLTKQAAVLSPSFVLDDKNRRLANWNAEILKKMLLDIVVRRKLLGTRPDLEATIRAKESKLSRGEEGAIVLDELENIIALPDHGHVDVDKEKALRAYAKLSDEVLSQLEDFVANIAATYRSNFFHSFEHASHVTMSVKKLLSRINGGDNDKHNAAHGITSDPLTQFSIVLSALIHDVDHQGVPNAQLIKENDSIAEKYRCKSVAEQNSIDLSWTLLMQDKYVDLRRAIYCNVEELDRFRKLVVNIVLATDIADKELGALRKERWKKAFQKDDSDAGEEAREQQNIDRKATIVMEHIIQASDIAHTMQHWHVYKKWNGRLFQELYQGYLDGRAEKDPSEGWYRGELGFFDFYIIPLARKLKECQVFGVSSDEYLTYAIQNRREWAIKGREVVEEFKAKVELEQGVKDEPATPADSANPGDALDSAVPADSADSAVPSASADSTDPTTVDESSD